MSIHRLIVRLDFKPNFDIIDRPGSIMRLVEDSAGQDYWRELRENRDQRQVIAIMRRDGKSANFTVEPSSVNFGYEAIEGLDFRRLADNDDISFLIKLMQDICAHFSVIAIERVGIRFFYFNKVLPSLDDVKRGFNQLYDRSLLDSTREHVGDIKDYLISFDGASDDKVEYHFKMGPYHQSEASKYLKELASEFMKNEEPNFICDLDLYENSISIPKVSFVKWLRPFIDKANKLLVNVESIIVAKGGK